MNISTINDIDWTTVLVWAVQVVGLATIIVKGLEKLIAPLQKYALRTASLQDDRAVAGFASVVRQVSHVLDLVRRVVGVFALQSPRLQYPRK